MYVADGLNGSIQKFDSNGTFLTAWYALNGRRGIELGGVAIGSSEHVFVTDWLSSVVQEYGQTPEIVSASLSGKVLTITGGGFGSSPVVLINAVDRTQFVVSGSDTEITLKQKPKKMGIKPGANTIQVTGAGGVTTNVFVLNR